jgi:hypothetical protein
MVSKIRLEAPDEKKRIARTRRVGGPAESGLGVLKFT